MHEKPLVNICYLLMTSDNKRRYLDHFSNRNCSLSQKINCQYHRIPTLAL